MVDKEILAKHSELSVLRTEQTAIAKLLKMYKHSLLSLKIEEMELRNRIEQLPVKTRLRSQEEGRTDEACATSRYNKRQGVKEEKEEGKEEEEEENEESKVTVIHPVTEVSLLDEFYSDQSKDGIITFLTDDFLKDQEMDEDIQLFNPSEHIITIEEQQQINSTPLDLEIHGFRQLAELSGDWSQEEDDE
ncbi:uncharacterized protein LOC135223677 isoform X1 [Macrobrachium nipponense]|uniref:uncharacterized protein LOC135223677 isoform X1 n=1 Tax=Macrobrachium nipponense TaxID=159736 RepID=UPI0030C8BBB2